MDPCRELHLLCRVWRAEAPLREEILCRRDVADLTDRAARLEASYAYKIGSAIVGAVRSPRAAVMLPIQLARLFGAWTSERVWPGIPGREARGPRAEPSGHRELETICPDPTLPRLPMAHEAPRHLAEVRIAAICDRFTADNIALECQVCFLSPEGWRDEIAGFRPHFLFVESAWQGLDGEWQGKVAGPEIGLSELVESCRLAGIPTIFWNKEDPLHFEAFISTARQFDHVCTTDLESISLYKRELGHDRVHLLPFALQPRLHNPVGEGERARPASFFAGAWYGNLHERCEDFVALADALALAGDFDILDRGASSNDPARKYPARYQAFIRGSVPYDKMADVCRQYVAGLSINTIKQSSSMYARRALELMGCGTSVYSNHCHALRLAFGDLVLSTDDGERMLRLAYRELSEPRAMLYRWRKVCALRKVLTEHTWSVRLASLAQKALQLALPSPGHRVAILTLARSEEELRRICVMAARQSEVDCTVFAVLPEGMASPENVTVLGPEARRQKISDVFGSALVAPWHPDDSYGAFYLQDMCLAELFGYGRVIGKAGYRRVEDGQLVEIDGEYRLVPKLALRRCMFPAAECQLTVQDMLESLDDGMIEGDGLLSIDALSYIEGARGSALPEDSLVFGDQGASSIQLTSLADQVQALDSRTEQEGGLTGAAMATHLPSRSFPDGVSFCARRERLELVSKLSRGESASVPSSPLEGAMALAGSVYLDAPACSAVTVYLHQCTADGRVLRRVVLPPYTTVMIDPVAEERFRRISFEIHGACVTYIDGVWGRPGPPRAPVLLGAGKLLLVANGYPARGDQYRNAFLHRRVKAYKQRGLAVDVVWVKEGVATTTYEFDGVEVTVCPADALKIALSRTRYEAIAAHFVDRPIWSAVEKASRDTPLTIWLHGAEIQSWTRRECNYASDAERESARSAWEDRRLFWQELFTTSASEPSFVFVSSSFMHEVLEDTGLPQPDRRRVIHNPIDTVLFHYTEKTDHLRWNILSVRPHASRIYANDLVSEVIHRLSREPEFEKMRFHLVGDGELFDQNFARLEQYGNVLIDRRFLAQEEIAELHRRNGIFLVPTRGDTHGVSRDEAMASGLVPVTCAAGSVTEFVDDACGIVTAVDDVEALAEGVLRVVRDPALFLELSRAAADRVRRQSAAELVTSDEIEALGLCWTARSDASDRKQLTCHYNCGKANADAERR